MKDDKPVGQVTERKSMPRQLPAFFTGWEVKKEMLRPLIVNLLTAAILFLAAVGLKDRIVSLFSPPQKVSDWPLFCVLEPEPNGSKEVPVIGDLFVINVSSKPYTDLDLAELAKVQSIEDHKGIDPFITVNLKENAQDGSITNIQPDDDFNKEKGSATIKQVDAGHWQVSVADIKPGMILKFIVTTTVKRPISSRASVETSPVRLNYARSP